MVVDKCKKCVECDTRVVVVVRRNCFHRTQPVLTDGSPPCLPSGQVPSFQQSIEYIILQIDRETTSSLCSHLPQSGSFALLLFGRQKIVWKQRRQENPIKYYKILSSSRAHVHICKCMHIEVVGSCKHPIQISSEISTKGDNHPKEICVSRKLRDYWVSQLFYREIYLLVTD